jgi:stage II sporulation protein D
LLLCLLVNNLYSINVSILIKKETISEIPFECSFEKVKKVYDLEDPEILYHVPEGTKKLVFTYKENTWYLNNKKLKIKKICLSNESEKENISYENCSYEGTILLQSDLKKIYVTNVVDLEKYVAAVVAKEFYSVWHLDSLKIAAIITRTYAVHKLLQRREASIYHLKNSIFDQHYCGYIHNEKIKNAVYETRGRIITWQKKPIMAMYHVCCGGVIPQECVGFNFEKHPYLERRKKCLGCKTYKRYAWEINLSHDIFCNYLSQFLNKNIVRVKRILKISHAKSGTVRRLFLEIETLKNKKKSSIVQVSLNNKQLRKILNLQLSIHSAFFKLQFDKNYNVKILGKGNGHHMGLCQIGMNEYIKNGIKIEEIIKFYYPKTQISLLEEILSLL